MFNIWAGVFYILGSSAYITFISKYMEVQFNKSSADAAIITGPLSILGLVIGFLSSGYIISKYKPSLRTLFLWNVLVGICFIMGQTSYLFLTCENGNQLTTTGKLNLTNSCNFKCACDAVPYSPVCDELTGTTYFSPCHAGCVEYVDNAKHYRNCSCTTWSATTWLTHYDPSTQSTANTTKYLTDALSTSTVETSRPFSTSTTFETSPDTTDTEIILQSEISTKTSSSALRLGTVYDAFTDESTVVTSTVASGQVTDSRDNSDDLIINSSTSTTSANDEISLRKRRQSNDMETSYNDEIFLVPGVCMAGCEFIFYLFTVISIFINMLGGTARISNILLNFRYTRRLS